MKMDLRCTMTFVYRSEEEARAVTEALEPDNKGFVETSVREKVLEATARSGTVEGLRHTLDDFLACLRVAEDAVGVVRAASIEADTED
jgi:hypothetical protein